MTNAASGRLLALAVAVVSTPVAAARVWTSIYRCDERTLLMPADSNRPNVYPDIMVGTRLVIVVSSDTGGYWWGGLLISLEDSDYGTLSGRGFSQEKLIYEGACLPAAGEIPLAVDFMDPDKTVGFQLTSDADIFADDGSLVHRGAVPGDWFILDYSAERVGSCDVGLYDFDANPDIPIEILSFNHVPSRDFKNDGIVNFEDFALLARCWRSAVEPDPNSPDAPFDLKADGRVDVADLTLFTEYRLERTDCNKPAADLGNSIRGR